MTAVAKFRLAFLFVDDGSDRESGCRFERQRLLSLRLEPFEGFASGVDGVR